MKSALDIPTVSKVALSANFSSDAPTLDQSNSTTSSFKVTEEEEEPRRLKGVPLGTNILVRRSNIEKSGLDRSVATEVSDEVTILAVGSDVHSIQVGDEAVARKFSGIGTEVKWKGNEYLIIDLRDVLLRIPRSAG
jgi:co-chaperonin GroES (HSP10)